MTATTVREIELLNADYRPLGTVTLQRAIKHLSKGKAVVELADETKGRLRNWAWPKVIRLVKMAKLNYKKIYGVPQLSRNGVLRRDGYQCAYCGGPAKTVDHVKPKDQFTNKADANTWLNLVAACFPCNNKKDNRTPEEAGMPLVYVKPFVPTRAQLLAVSSKG
jgi:5-methylcytosine-specific restriction endonuclease McrA